MIRFNLSVRKLVNESFISIGHGQLHLLRCLRMICKCISVYPPPHKTNIPGNETLGNCQCNISHV